MSDIFNNELFEAFASASDNVFIYVCDMKTNISRWSKASVEYFGLSGEYLEDAATIWEQHIHPDDRALYNEDISGVFSGTKPRHECQYRARNRMGEYVWVECKGSVIWDDAGNPIMLPVRQKDRFRESKYFCICRGTAVSKECRFQGGAYHKAGTLFGICQDKPQGRFGIFLC